MHYGKPLSIASPPGGRERARRWRVVSTRCTAASAIALLLSACAMNGEYATKYGIPQSQPATAEMESAPSAPRAPAPHGGGTPASLGRDTAATGTPQLAKTSGGQETAEARSPGTLLVYEANYTVAVYQVREALDAVEALAKRAGGHLVERTEQHIVIRVPRDRFEETLSGVDSVGDVVRRDVRSEDVTDQYRDLEVRLRNARAVRGRLEELLTKAQTVEDSLKIEQQLGRVTEEIERLTATLKTLSDRVAYSKITVAFQPRAAEQVPDKVLRLPFPWLQSLGLSPLLNLHE